MKPRKRLRIRNGFNEQVPISSQSERYKRRHNVLAVPNRGRNLAEMICFGGFSRLDPRAALVAGLGLALPLALAGPLGAQSARPAPNDKTEKLNALKQHDEECTTFRLSA